MRVLIGCEESQVVCKAFRARGHEAYSCDLLPTRGNPEWHIQADIKNTIMNHGYGWFDLIILHPDCTKLSLSGNRWYGKGTPRHNERIVAIEWTADLWRQSCARCKRVVLENPTSVIFKHLNGVDLVQYIQPHWFGHGEQKKTGLALHNVKPLVPTSIVSGREQRVWRMAPGPNRKRDRSETYQGIADAMAEQWG